MTGQVTKQILLAFASLVMTLIMPSNNLDRNFLYPDVIASVQMSTSASNCNKEITHLALSPDSSLLATSDDITSSIELWDTGTYALIKTLPVSGEHVTDITFSSDNQLLVWASSIGGIDMPYVQGSIEIYNIKSDKVTASLNDVADVVTELNVFDDSTISFIGAKNGYLRANVQIWDTATQTNIAKRDAWDIAPAFSTRSLTSFLGTQLSLGITNEFSYQIEEWDGENNIVLRTTEVVNLISALAVNHDSSMLALADNYGTISFWDTSTITSTLSFESADESVEYLAFIGNDQLLSVGQNGNQQNIRIWNIDSQLEIFAQKSFSEKVIGKFAAEANQQVLVLANEKDAPFGISLWNYKTDTVQVVELDC
jgi:WD40 repeat protein